MKEALWPRFGYAPEAIRRMASQEYWDGEYEKIWEADPLIEEVRGELPAA